MTLTILATIITLVMAISMNFYRLKAAQHPTSVKKIVLPPIFMSTGNLMFLFPVFRVEWYEVIIALIVGMIFSILLTATTQLEIRDRNIYLIPSKLFVFVLFGLLGFRLIAKIVMNQQISLGETSGIFYLLAFGMIISWRVGILYKYKKLKGRLKSPQAEGTELS